MTLSDDQVRDLLGADAVFPAITERSTTTLDGLIDVLGAARRRGWTVDAEESFRGVVGVAVPLDGWAPSDPQLALGVAIPVADADFERIERVGHALVEAAAALTNPFSSARRR